jgi:hypothetical protein
VTTAPPPAATAEAPEPPSPFYVAVEASEPSLYVLGKTAFVGQFRGGTFLEVHGDALVRRDDLAQGIALCKDDESRSIFRYIGGLFGTGPEAMWLTIEHNTARTGYATFLRWAGARWTATRLPQLWGSNLLGVHPWRRSTFLLASNRWTGSSFVRLSGSDAAPVLTAAKDAAVPCQATVMASSAASFSSGHLMIAGDRCSDRNGLLVERWAPDAAGSVLDEVLPATADNETSGAALAGGSASDVYVGTTLTPRGKAGPYLAHYDGRAWTATPTPLGHGISAMVRGDEGTYWVLERPRGLWMFRPGAQGGGWEKVPLPRDRKGGALDVSDVQIAPDGAVWLRAGNLLLRTGPARETFVWNDPICPPVAAARPALESCTGQVFVLLYTLVKTTPPDYDFPALREAVKGRHELAGFRFVETEENGKRYLVGFPSDKSTNPLGDATRLAQRVKQKVPGSTPTLLCGSPREVRTLRIDLATGSVVGPPKGAAPLP